MNRHLSRSSSSGMALFAMSCWLSTLPAAAQPAFRIVEIDTWASADAVNKRGDVVGSTGPTSLLFFDGQVSYLNQPGWDYSGLFDLNDRGEAVGYYSVNEVYHAILYSRCGGVRELWSPGTAVGINQRGTVVGYQVLPGDPLQQRAVIYRRGTLEQIDTLGGDHAVAHAINDRGDVVGASTLVPGNWSTHAFLYRARDRALIDLGALHQVSSEAWDINDRGDVVGYLSTPEQASSSAFLYTDGVMTRLPIPWHNSSASAINNKGQIVGQGKPDGATFHAFLYEDGQLYDLQMLLNLPQPWVVHSASDINDRGQILASACGTECRAIRLDPL